MMRFRFLFGVFFFFFSATSVQAEENACGWILSTTGEHKSVTVSAARGLRKALEGTGARVSLYEDQNSGTYLIRIHGKNIDLSQVREKVLSLKAIDERGENILTPGNMGRAKRICFEGTCLFGALFLFSVGTFELGQAALHEFSGSGDSSIVGKIALTGGAVGSAVGALLSFGELVVRPVKWMMNHWQEGTGGWQDQFSVQKLITRVKRKIRQVRLARYARDVDGTRLVKGASLIYLIDQEGADLGFKNLGFTFVGGLTLDQHLHKMGFTILYRE